MAHDIRSSGAYLNAFQLELARHPGPIIKDAIEQQFGFPYGAPFWETVMFAAKQFLAARYGSATVAEVQPPRGLIGLGRVRLLHDVGDPCGTVGEIEIGVAGVGVAGDVVAA